VESEILRPLYRLIQANRATLSDFMSHDALGIPPRRPLTPRQLDQWHGVSFQNSRETAVVKGTESPWLGRYIAEVHIPPGVLVRIEQTGRDRSHFTVWAAADDLLSWVVSIVPVEAVD
jgi:hypothetical protein